MAASSSGPPLVVWDFDWSLIDANSDTHVVQDLDLSGSTWEKLKSKDADGALGWTQLMDWCVGELHALGITPGDIAASMASMPILEGARGAVAAAQAAGATQRILSDANQVYISTFLAPRPELAGAISSVETNGAAYGEDGRLSITPHQPADAPHGCDLCPPNLCKGAVLSRWLEAAAPRTCVYIGDGQGDFCPATRLRKGDVLLTRRKPHNGLLREVRAQPRRVKAKVVEWGGAKDPDAAHLLRGMKRALQEPSPKVGVASRLAGALGLAGKKRAR